MFCSLPADYDFGDIIAVTQVHRDLLVLAPLSMDYTSPRSGLVGARFPMSVAVTNPAAAGFGHGVVTFKPQTGASFTGCTQQTSLGTSKSLAGCVVDGGSSETLNGFAPSPYQLNIDFIAYTSMSDCAAWISSLTPLVGFYNLEAFTDRRYADITYANLNDFNNLQIEADANKATFTAFGNILAPLVVRSVSAEIHLDSTAMNVFAPGRTGTTITMASMYVIPFDQATTTDSTGVITDDTNQIVITQSGQYRLDADILLVDSTQKPMAGVIAWVFLDPTTYVPTGFVSTTPPYSTSGTMSTWSSGDVTTVSTVVNILPALVQYGATVYIGCVLGAMDATTGFVSTASTLTVTRMLPNFPTP